MEVNEPAHRPCSVLIMIINASSVSMPFWILKYKLLGFWACHNVSKMRKKKNRMSDSCFNMISVVSLFLSAHLQQDS